MTDAIELTVDTEFPDRLDVYLSIELDSVSRSKIKSWCSAGLVVVDGRARKGSYVVQDGMEITITPPEEKELERIVPEDIPLDIVHEDDAVIVVNKAAGMVVHPGSGVYSGTLVHALAFHFKQLAAGGGALRPGIVHRLDKGTTGLILVAKTDEAHRMLSDQWKAGTVTKVYQALVWGVPDPATGELETRIGRHPKYRQIMAADVEGGRIAKSRYKVTAAYPEAARCNVHILTGRTHQIRVHMSHLGHPVVGDAMYGKARHRALAKSFEAMPEHPMLHAALLRFVHPLTGKDVTFKQPPPAAFTACEAALSTWP